MPDDRPGATRTAIVRLVAALTLGALVAVAPSIGGASTGTTIVDIDFSTTTIAQLESSGWTFFGNFSPGPAIVDGRLRLTEKKGNQAGAARYDVAQPTSAGLRVQFRQLQAGGTGADGIAFFLVDGQATVTGTGNLGSGLGYNNLPTSPANRALLGIGLDRFGGNSTCGAQSLVVRDGSDGGFGQLACAGSQQWNLEQLVTIEVDPSNIINPRVRVYLGESETLTLNVPQPAQLRGVSTFKFGFSASTGGSTNNHDIWDLTITSLTTLPDVTWVTPTTLPAGNAGTPYSTSLSVENGINPVTFSLDGGALPPGVSLHGSSLTGSPTRAGTYSFTVIASDNRSPASTASRTFSLTVTANLPTVTTAAASSIGTGSATLGGDVTSDGGGDIVSRGVVWSKAENPTIPAPAGSSATADGTIGDFAVSASGLEPGVTYYARAFAENSAGTAYGPQITFTTLRLPQAITLARPDDRDYSPEPFDVDVSVDSGLPAALTAAPAGVCEIDGTSITMLAAGTCTVTATQAGDATYAPAPSEVQSFTIAPAAQTIAFTAPEPRVYARESFDAVVSASPSGLPVALATVTPDVCSVAGVTVTIEAAGTCELAATQSGDARYREADAVVRTFTVAPRVLSLTGSRVYDGTTTITAGTLAVSGLFDSETLDVTGDASVASASPDVGVDLPLDVSGVTLADGDGGGLAANYVLDGGVHTLTITPRPVRGAFVVTGRPYDGTPVLADTNVTARSLGAVPGVAASGVVAVAGTVDDVRLSGGTATLAAAAADEGTPTAVELVGASLTGARAANYALESVTPTTATITRRPVTVAGTFTAAGRVYDGTVAATITGDALRLVGTITGDDVVLAPTVAFDSAAAGAGRTVRLTAASTLSGAAASNYRLFLTGAPSAAADISRRPLTVASGAFTAAGRTYDGTDTATILSSTLQLTGLAPGDTMADLTWTPAGRFRVRDAGATRTVELVGGDVLGGPKGGSYTLDTTGAPTATATIAPRPVTVTGATAASRPYDGTAGVTVSGAAIAGAVDGDAVTLSDTTTGVAASPRAGTHAVSTAMRLTGPAAPNYRLTGQPSLTVSITPLPVSVTMNALPSRPYDGSVDLPLPAAAFTVSGVLPGETIAVSGTGRLSSRAAGTRTVTLGAPTFTPGPGTFLTDYALPSSVSGSVTVTPLPAQVVGASVVTRAWDGTDRAELTGARLEGIRPGDNVTLAGAASGTFTAALPGTHPVRFSPTLAGVDALNYTLVVPELSGTITRAAATLRITGGLVQFADGSARTVLAAVTPAAAGRVVVSYAGGGAPSEPGLHPVTVSLESATHAADPVDATLVIRSIDALLFPTSAADLGSGQPADLLSGTAEGTSAAEVDDARREALLARLAVRPDSTLALPEIGPVLEDDGTAPALAPRALRVLADGITAAARVVIVDEQRVRIETEDGGSSIELQASLSGPDGNVPLPVSADGTLLLDRDGLVEVGGSGFLPGSTAEVWMFSTATFLGTALVGSDGTFAGAFPMDELLEAGDHTIQLNGMGADRSVRSTSLGVRIDDPSDPVRDRVVIASATERDARTGPLGLLALAAALGAATMRWWQRSGRRGVEQA